MSRLVESDVNGLAQGLAEYDRYLAGACGTGLAGIARAASGKQDSAQGVRVGVVPVTSGQGVIGGFCAAVAGIVRHLGAEATITQATDVKGVWEAVEQKCHVIFTADDDAFIAVNLPKQLASDNSEATGRGFAAALELAAGGISGKEALVLGAGPVGCAAAAALHGKGARVSVYDIDSGKAAKLAESLTGATVSRSLESALTQIPLVLDATPASGFLTRAMLRADTILSAPGVPLGADGQARMALGRRLVHNVLEIGVATMLFDVL